MHGAETEYESPGAVASARDDLDEVQRVSVREFATLGTPSSIVVTSGI